jgi:hypothetical protein
LVGNKNNLNFGCRRAQVLLYPFLLLLPPILSQIEEREKQEKRLA